MKKSSNVRCWTARVWTVCTLAGFACGGGALGADAPDPAKNMEEARRLEEKAADLKAAGQGAEAEKLMAEVRSLRAKASPPQAGREGRQDPDMARRQELRRRLAELNAELKERVAAGQEEPAAEIRRQIEGVEREFRELAGRDRVEGPGRGEAVRPGAGPDRMTPDRQWEHVERAADNLRAAGMPEMAERVVQEARRMRQRGGPSIQNDEVDRLRAEVQDLRRAVDELQRRFEELGRRRP